MNVSSEPGRVLVIDDEKSMRLILSEVLADHGYKVDAASNGIEALNRIASLRPHVAIIDLQMPNMTGLDVLSNMAERYRPIPSVILTAHGSIDSAVKAMKAGAFDYLTKPFDNNQLLLVVENAVRFSRLSEEVADLKSRLDGHRSVDAILGDSLPMKHLRSQILKVAATEATVLIEGESGAGKELVARAIHFESKRRGAALVAVNCAAIPSNLAESEFFGHEKGAFTDARDTRIGKFEKAKGGTLFLDEVAELSPEIQAKLLRVLQEKQFTRVGGDLPLQADVRLIAATNKDLNRQVANGEFREDLFYRLGVVRLQVPSLAEHPEDIPTYAALALKRAGDALVREFQGFSDEALARLKSRRWKGNIRELENAIQQAAIFASGPTIQAHELERSSALPPSSHPRFEPENGLDDYISTLVRTEEKRIILDSLNQTGWNRSATADLLKTTRRTLFEKMRSLGLEPDQKEA